MSKETAQEIHSKAEPFISWLKNAEEETDSEEDDDDSDDGVEVDI